MAPAASREGQGRSCRPPRTAGLLVALLAGPRSVAPAEAGPPRVFIFGLGYTGSAIGRALAATHGCAVMGTRRSAADELNGVVTFDEASGLCAAGRDALAMVDLWD